MDQFKGIGMNIYLFFFDFLGQNLLKNDISIHRICPQSGLKHSVVHFKGIGMKIIILKKICLSKYVQKTNFYP